MKSLQLFVDTLVDFKRIMDLKREKQEQRFIQAQKHLSDMERSNGHIEKDLRNAYGNYKLGVTDKETYLEQRKTYEQMLERLRENIEKQKAAVSKLAVMDVPEILGFEMLEGRIKRQKLNREIVETFVEEIIVYAKDRIEIRWKFRDEFKK